MIRHVVLCRFRRDVSEVAIAQIFDALKALQQQIDGIIAITAGRDNSPEGLQKGCSHGLHSWISQMPRRVTDYPAPSRPPERYGAMIVAAAEGGCCGHYGC